MFMATRPVDLRRSYDGLCAIVEGTFGRSARSGDLFVFINRRANQVRILFWDHDGYCIVMKRLEAGERGAVLEAWRGHARAGLGGSAVRWNDESGERRGLVRDVDDAGALVVEADRGTERLVAGEVFWERLRGD